MTRRDFKVMVTGNQQLLHGGVAEIVIEESDGLTLFHVKVGGNQVATCLSAKRLNDWSFESGAQSVSHRYDLNRSDSEA